MRKQGKKDGKAKPWGERGHLKHGGVSGEKKGKGLVFSKQEVQRHMTTYKINIFGKSFHAGMQVPSIESIPDRGLHEELVGLPGKNCSNLAPNGLI